MRKRILVDMDGVIAHLITPWVDKYNELYDDYLKSEQITTWDWHHLVKPECGEEIYKMLTPDLFESLPVIAGSQNALERLNQDHDVYIVTAAGNSKIIPAKADWLKKHFPFIKKDRVVYAIDSVS